MDDITNVMDAGAARPAAAPSIRVRVVDSTTRQDMHNKAEVVFVPCADGAPVKMALGASAELTALQSLPARKFVVRATAPGYAQVNYLDGPISLYYEHLVIDARGQPQREVLVEMERRVAACWLSVTDVRSGSALPTAQIQLMEEGVVAHAFDAPGPHDVAAVKAVSQTYDIQLRLAGYVLHGPSTITLERGQRVDLHVTARRTDVDVVCRDLRSGRRIDDVDVTLINVETGDVLHGTTIDVAAAYRITCRVPGFRQVTRLGPCAFAERLFTGTAPLEVRVDLEPYTTPSPLATPERAVWGWLALDQKDAETAPKKKKKKIDAVHEWGTCTIDIRAVDATYQRPSRLEKARVLVDGKVAGETDDRGALQLKVRAPKETPTCITLRLEKGGFIGDTTTVSIQAQATELLHFALRRTIIQVSVVHASSGKAVLGDVEFELTPDDARVPLPAVGPGDGLVMTVAHDGACFDGVVSQRHRCEGRTSYDVVGVDGSDLALTSVRREDLGGDVQRELEIGETVSCAYPHRGRYIIKCGAPGLRLAGPSIRTFAARDFTEKGPLQLTLRLEPSVGRLRVACATESGIPVGALVEVGGERIEVGDDGSFSTHDVPLPAGKASASVSLRVAAPQHVQVPPFEASISAGAVTEVVAYVRPCDLMLKAVSRGRILPKATLQLIRVDAAGDDDEVRVVRPGSRVAVDLGAEYRVMASARGHRQTGLLRPFVVTPDQFLKQLGPVLIAVDMVPDVGALDLAVLDVVGRPVKAATVTCAYLNSSLPDLYLGHRRGVQELGLAGEADVEVDLVCESAGYVQVSPQRLKVKAGRLRKTTVILRRSTIVLRAIDAKSGKRLKAEHLRLELQPIEGDGTLTFEGAGGEVFGPAQAVDLGRCYRVCTDASKARLVNATNVTFTPSDFAFLEDPAPLAPLLQRARDLARRKAKRSTGDDEAEAQLNLEIDARLAKVLEVRVEPLVCSINLDVVDARTGLPCTDIELVLKTEAGEVDLGLQRGLLEDLRCPGGGDTIRVEVLAKSCDRVQLAPTHFDLRAGTINDVTVYMRDADVCVHCVDKETGDALIPDACYLEGGTTIDASEKCRVVIDRDYDVTCVVPRYRCLNTCRFRATAEDFRSLSDVEAPYQLVVHFEPCETDINVHVEDAATGDVLGRVHVRIGPHALGCTRGVESLRLPVSQRIVTWPIACALRGWVLVAPRDVELHATPQDHDDPRAVTIQLRRCEVLVRAVDALTREPLDARCVLEPFDEATSAPWRLDDADDVCVVDVQSERTGVIKSVGDAYDIALDDGTEELECTVDELRRDDNTTPPHYVLNERVVVARQRGAYVLRASCDGYQQLNHLEPMTFSLQDFAGLPVQEPLRIEVELEAVAGVIDVSVEDKRGAKIRTCELWIDGVPLGTQRGLVPINLPGGGGPHEAQVAVACSGYSLVGPSVCTVFAGHTTPLNIRLVATRCLIRVEDARDGAPIECRVCLVKESVQKVTIGDRVDALVDGEWVAGVLRGDVMRGDAPYRVEIGDELVKVTEVRPLALHADPDLDPGLDGRGQNWCDWRTMSPLAIDCKASYRIILQDPQGEFRQVSHYEPVTFDVDELVKFKTADREHRNDSLARKLLLKKKRRPTKWSWFSSAAQEPPARDEATDSDKAARVALIVVHVAPRVAAASFRVVDQSGKALKADVCIGGTNLGTRRGHVELDWCAIAPDAFLPPACTWRHAAGARADGSGVPCAVVASLEGYVQTSQDVVPFSSTGVTSFDVEMRKATLTCACYDAATSQKLGDVAVDLVPLDGQIGVRWTAGSAQAQRVAVGKGYRVVARGGRLRQTTPSIDEDVVFTRSHWAQLDANEPAELRVLLERRVATVEVKVVDASLPTETILTKARGTVGATHFSAAEGWTQDVDLPCGRQAAREMPALCSLDDYLQLAPKRCDVFVGDANNVNQVVLRMRPLHVSLRASSIYDDKVLEDVQWRLKPQEPDQPLVPLQHRAKQCLRLGHSYTLECAVDGWRPCLKHRGDVIEVDTLIVRFEGIEASEPLPLDIQFEASSVRVRLHTVNVENGEEVEASSCTVEVAGRHVPYGSVIEVPLPEDADASQGCVLDVTASLPDASLTFLPLRVKCYPGSPDVVDVECVFKGLFVKVLLVDERGNELTDATYQIDEGERVASGQRAPVHIGTHTLTCDAAGRRQTSHREPLIFGEADFVAHAEGGFQRELRVLCAPRMATINVTVTDATTNEALHRALIEIRAGDDIIWTSVGTPADRKGMRRALLDDVPGAGDDVEVTVTATLEGYTQIDPRTCVIRAGATEAAPWTCELLMRKYYVFMDIVDSALRRVEGAGVELRPQEGSVVAYQPREISDQTPQPIRLGTAYDVRPTCLASLQGAAGEYFFRNTWHSSDTPVVFEDADFAALERKARESLKKAVMKSEDPRYPYLKRVCERPTWHALHSWIQAANVKRRGFDVALPPLKLAVRACPGRALVDVRVVNSDGAPLRDAATRCRSGQEWSALEHGRQDMRVPGGGSTRRLEFDAVLDGHLSEAEVARDVRASYVCDDEEPVVITLVLHPVTLRINVTDGDKPSNDAKVSLMATDDADTPLENKGGVCEAPLALDEAVVITAANGQVTRTASLRYSAGDVRRKWAASKPGAPVSCDIDLAKANARVKLTVTDGEGKVLEDAAVDFGGSILKKGEHSTSDAPRVEVPSSTELRGCALPGYVLTAPDVGWRLPSDASDDFDMTLTMRATLLNVALVDTRGAAVSTTGVRVTLTASSETVAGLVGDPLHIKCGTPYEVELTSSSDLTQVSHLTEVTFEDAAWASQDIVSLNVTVDIPARFIVSVVDADSGAPLSNAILELNGDVVPRGAVEGYETCHSLKVRATLQHYLQLTPSQITVDPKLKTSLVVAMRRCQVFVDLRDALSQEALTAHITLDERVVKDGVAAVEDGREYALEVLSEGREPYRKRVRFDRALFLSGPFTHTVLLKTATARVDVSVVDLAGTPLLKAEVMIGTHRVGLDRGPCDVPLLKTCDVGCRLPGHALMKPRLLTLQRGETTTCRCIMRQATVTHALKGANVALVSPEGRVALPGSVVLGTSYTLTSATHNIEERRVTFEDDAWDGLGGDEALELAIGVEEAVVEESNLIDVRVAVVDADGGDVPTAAVSIGATNFGRRRSGRVPRGAVPVSTLCPGYVLISPRIYDGQPSLNIVLRKTLVRARALHNSQELAGCRVLFAKKDAPPVAPECVDADQEYTVSVAFDDGSDDYRIAGACATWPNGSKAWNNPFVVMTLPRDAWAEASHVLVDVALVPTKAELLLDVREEASGFPVTNGSLTVSMGEAVMTYPDARGLLRIPLDARADAALTFEYDGFEEWHRTLSLRAGTRCELEISLRRLEEDASSYGSIRQSKRMERTLNDVWAASRRALTEDSRSNQTADVTAELNNYVLLRPQALDVGFSNTVTPLTVTMRRCCVRGTCYDVRTGGVIDAAVTIEARDPEKAPPGAGGDVALNASYAVRCTRDGWRQVTLLKPFSPLARHFGGGDAKKPVDVSVAMEPTLIDVRARITDARDGSPLHALVTVQGLAIESGLSSLKVEELRSRWVRHDDDLALPLVVHATLEGYVAATTTVYARARGGGPPTDISLKLRRADIAIRCVDAQGGVIDDAVDVLVEGEGHTLTFGGIEADAFDDWVAAQKRVNKRDRSPALQAILAAVDGVKSELFAIDATASAAQLLNVFRSHSGADAARLASAAGRSCRRGVVVGASYVIRASHDDYRCSDLARRFDADAWSGLNPHEPLVVDVPLTPVFCDITLRVVDAATGRDVRDAAADVCGVDLGATRTARLRLFEEKKAVEAAVIVRHKTYAQVKGPQQLLRPGAPIMVSVEMRPTRVVVRPMHAGEPVPLASCSLIKADTGVPLDASAPALIELGVAYNCLVTHATLVQVGDTVITFRADQFCDEDLLLTVDMADRGASVHVEVIDEGTGEAIAGARPSLNGLAVDGSVDDVTWRRCAPMLASCGHPTFILASACLRVQRGADVTTDEAQASADGCLVPHYTPKADEHATLVLKLRPLQVLVRCVHATDPTFAFDTVTLALAPRDASVLCTDLNVARQTDGWLVTGFPPCPAGYMLAGAVGDATARAVPLALADFLKAPRGQTHEISVTFEPIIGDVALNVLDDERSNVTLGCHRLGGWRGAIRLIGVEGGGRSTQLAVDAASETCVGAADCSVKAGAQSDVTVKMRRTFVDVVVKDTDGALLKDGQCAFIDNDGRVLDAPCVVSASWARGVRDGSNFLTDDGQRLVNVPASLIVADGDRVKAPRRWYSLRVSKAGYRLIGEDLVAFAPDQFTNNEPYQLEASMELDEEAEARDRAEAEARAARERAEAEADAAAAAAAGFFASHASTASGTLDEKPAFEDAPRSPAPYDADDYSDDGEAAPAPAPDATARSARVHVIDARTDAPLPDAQLIVDGTRQAQGIVSSALDSIDLKCVLRGYVQLGPVSNSLDTGTFNDMAAWATDDLELRMRPSDVQFVIAGEDGCQEVALVLTAEASLLRATHDAVIVVDAGVTYEVSCVTQGWACIDTSFAVDAEAFRATEACLVKEVRIERARVDVDIEVVDVATGDVVEGASVEIGGAAVENASLPWAAAQGEAELSVTFPDASWFVLRPRTVALDHEAKITVEVRRATCIISVVEQYTQTPLEARVTCGDRSVTAGEVFDVTLDQTYPLSVVFEGAEAVTEVTLEPTADTFSVLEDGQPLIVTVEMRATHANLDLRAEDLDGNALDATITLDGEAHGPGSIIKPFAGEADECTFAVHAACAGYAFVGPSTLSVSRAKIGIMRELIVTMRPAAVAFTVVDEAGQLLPDAVVRLTPPDGPSATARVDVNTVYTVDAALRKCRRQGVRCSYGTITRDHDDVSIVFTDADFGRSSEPLEIEITLEPARCVIDLSLVEETPTDATLETVEVGVGNQGFSTDRRWSASLADLDERLAVSVKSKTHVLVGPTFIDCSETPSTLTLGLRPALVEALVFDEDRSPVAGADVWLKPIDDALSASIVVMDKGTPQQALVEIGRAYAVTSRKEQMRCLGSSTFTVREEQLRALKPCGLIQLEISMVRTRRATVDLAVRGLYDVANGPDDPASLASVSITTPGGVVQDLGTARGLKDVDAADRMEARCSLRGWAQLPPYAIAPGDGTTEVHLEMVPALVRLKCDEEVRCWLESDRDTVQVSQAGLSRVQVGTYYKLRVRAPGLRLAKPYLVGLPCADDRTVTFTDEQFWERSRNRPFAREAPVVLELELVLEPATCELDLKVNTACALTLERPGLPDLALTGGSQIIESLPAATVTAVARATMTGQVQLKPLGPITLEASKKHVVDIEMRPASVVCTCVDARTGHVLQRARVRYEADGAAVYGSHQKSVLVDCASYRSCVIVENMGDAYRIKRDDGVVLVVDAGRLSGSGDAWTSLEKGPTTYKIGDSVSRHGQAGTIEAVLDSGKYGVAFDQGTADVDAEDLEPVDWDFKQHLPSKLACKVRTGGQYNLSGELDGWRQVNFNDPYLFETEAFVALGGPVPHSSTEWDATVTPCLSTSSKPLLTRFLRPMLGRALRTWQVGAEATREARQTRHELVSPPLQLIMRLVPGVGAVELDVSCDGEAVDAAITLIPTAGSKVDPPLALGTRRGVIKKLAVAGAGEPAIYNVASDLNGYRVLGPRSATLCAGACTPVHVTLGRCVVTVRLASHATRKAWCGEAVVKVVSKNAVLAEAPARDGVCEVLVDPGVVCKIVVDAPRHEQTSLVDSKSWAAHDFDNEVEVEVTLRATAVTLDVSVVDAAHGRELAAAHVVVGGFAVGARRGFVDVAADALQGLLGPSDGPHTIEAAAALEGYHALPPYDVQVIKGGISKVFLRLRRFEVVLMASTRRGGRSEAVPAAVVTLRCNDEDVPCINGVYRVAPGRSYVVRATCEHHRQASLTEAMIFQAHHFNDGLCDALHLNVELEADLFEALVRVVDDETGAPLDGAVVQLDGFETCGPTPASGWRRIGRALPGISGPAVFLPCVAAAPRRVQTSRARIELRNDGSVPCVTLRLRRASISVRVVDDEGRPVQDPVVQVGLSNAPEEVSTPRVGTMALDRRRPAPAFVRPRNEVLVVLDHFYDVRVVHDAMRQRDLLDPQRFDAGDFSRRRGDDNAALTVRMEPYRCAVDLKVVDAFGDDLPHARVRLGEHDLGTRRGALDLGPNGGVAASGE